MRGLYNEKRVKERKGVNETPRRGGSVGMFYVPWTGSLFIAAEVGFGPL